MAGKTVATAKPGERVKIAPRLYEYGRKDGLGCSYYADIVMDGRQVRQKLAATTRGTARTERARLTADKSRGLVATPSKITVGEVAAEWFKQLDVKARSRESYELHLRTNILPRLGSKPIQSVQPRDCTALLRWLRDDRKLATATQTSALNVLRAIFRHAIVEGYIVSSPLDRISRKAQKQKKVPHRYLSPAEVARLLDSSNGYRPLFEVLAFAGLRCSEGMGLVWGDIDLAEGTIHVQAQLSRGDGKRVPTKTDETRVINIDPELVSTLREHKEQAFALGRAGSEQFVFQTATATQSTTAISGASFRRRRSGRS